MALIYLSGRRDPVEVQNEKAKSIKSRWVGEGAEKAPSDGVVDLGWVTFQYAQIKQIEIQADRVPESENYDRKLTPQEQSRRRTMMNKIRKELEERGVLDAPKQTERGLNTVADLLK